MTEWIVFAMMIIGTGVIMYFGKKATDLDE